MAFEFKLPDIGEGVAEGEVVKWMVKKGDSVKEDQPIVEVMTDKATVEIASPKTGKISQLMAKEGEVVKVGKGLVLIEEGKSETVSAPKKEDRAQPAAAAPAPTPQPARPQPSAPTNGAGRILASPATRKLAREQGVDLSQVHGSGPHGRVTREDLQAGGAPRPAAPAPLRPGSSVPRGGEERIPLRGIRKKIAENMTRSKHTAAHFTHVDEVDMTELVALRESLKPKAEQRGIKITYIPFLIRAICRALEEYPGLNATLDETKNEIVIKHYCNVGIAVNTKDNDLIVPVVKDADQKSILQLAAEIHALAEKARTGHLNPADLQGGTFTLTSLGNLGGLFATPIINFPEVAILGFHQIKETPVVRDGKIVIRKMAHLSLSLDHRIVDGALGASFMVALIRYLEDPKLLFNLLDA